MIFEVMQHNKKKKGVSNLSFPCVLFLSWANHFWLGLLYFSVSSRAMGCSHVESADGKRKTTPTTFSLVVKNACL